MTDLNEPVSIASFQQGWNLGGAQYYVSIMKRAEDQKWSFLLTEKFPNKTLWEREGTGYQSMQGAKRAAASAYKKRAKLSNNLDKLVEDLFS